MKRKIKTTTTLPKISQDKDAPVVINTKNGKRTAAYKKSGGCCGKRRYSQ
ncbi:hypothetical protein [Halobacillus sp. B29]